jgi:hypothetical protein
MDVFVAPTMPLLGVALTEQFLARIGGSCQAQCDRLPLDPLSHGSSLLLYQLAAPPQRHHPSIGRNVYIQPHYANGKALVTADSSGRPPLPPDRPAQNWLFQAEILNCADQRQPDLILGRDLISWGLSAGVFFGKVLTKIRAAQLKGQFYDRESALAWILAHCPEIQLVKGRDLIARGYPADSQLGNILKATFARQLRGEFKRPDPSNALVAGRISQCGHARERIRHLILLHNTKKGA